MCKSCFHFAAFWAPFGQLKWPRKSGEISEEEFKKTIDKCVADEENEFDPVLKDRLEEDFQTDEQTMRNEILEIDKKRENISKQINLKRQEF